MRPDNHSPVQLQATALTEISMQTYHAGLKYNFEIQNPCLVALLPVVSWYGIYRCSIVYLKGCCPALAMSSCVLLSRSTNPFREAGASSDSNHGRLEEDTLTHLQPWLC